MAARQPKPAVIGRRAVTVRLELEERERLHASAVASGLSLQQWIRQSLGLGLDKPQSERRPEGLALGRLESSNAVS